MFDAWCGGIGRAVRFFGQDRYAFFQEPRNEQSRIAYAACAHSGRNGSVLQGIFQRKKNVVGDGSGGYSRIHHSFRSTRSRRSRKLHTIRQLSLRTDDNEYNCRKYVFACLFYNSVPAQKEPFISSCINFDAPLHSSCIADNGRRSAYICAQQH